MCRVARAGTGFTVSLLHARARARCVYGAHRFTPCHGVPSVLCAHLHCAGSVARRHRRHGSAAGDVLAKVARPLYTVPYAMIAPSGTQLWHASRRRFLSAIAVPTKSWALAVFENLTQ